MASGAAYFYLKIKAAFPGKPWRTKSKAASRYNRGVLHLLQGIAI